MCRVQVERGSQRTWPRRYICGSFYSWFFGRFPRESIAFAPSRMGPTNSRTLRFLLMNWNEMNFAIYAITSRRSILQPKTVCHVIQIDLIVLATLFSQCTEGRAHYDKRSRNVTWKSYNCPQFIKNLFARSLTVDLESNENHAFFIYFTSRYEFPFGDPLIIIANLNLSEFWVARALKRQIKKKGNSSLTCGMAEKKNAWFSLLSKSNVKL